MRRFHWLALSLVLLLAVGFAVVACGGDSEETTTTAAATATTAEGAGTSPAGSTEPLKVGAVMSLTGPSAPPGMLVLNSIKLEVDAINAAGGVNGRQIELIVEDDAGDTSKAVAATTKLIDQDKVTIILGPFAEYEAPAMRQLTEKSQIPHLAPVPAHLDEVEDNPYEWSFATVPTQDANTKVEVGIIKGKGFQNIVIVGDTLTIHQETNQLVADELEAAGIKATVMPDTWDLAEADVGPVSSKIAAAVESAGADALLLHSNPIHLPAIVQNLRGQGVDIPIVTSPAAAFPAIFSQGPEVVEGLIIPGGGLTDPSQVPDGTPGKDVQMAFFERHMAEYGEPPVFFGGFGADTVRIMEAALLAAGSDDKAAIRDAIEGLQDFQGVQGAFSYSPEDHVGIHGGFMEWTVKDGKFTFVGPVEGAE